MPDAFPSALLGSGRYLTIRGAGHSCDGQTVTADDVLVTYPGQGDATSLVHDLGGGLFEVPAGSDWYQLERYLNRRGRHMPVLTDYLHLSVGGTLSVGGIGVDSVRHGLQIDHVESIQVVDGTGASRWCSRTDHPRLFRFALGGLGTAGLIERAVLRTVAHQRTTHIHRKRHTSVPELTDYLVGIAQRNDIDVFQAKSFDDEFHSYIGWHEDISHRCRGEDCLVYHNLSFVSHNSTAPSAETPVDRVRLWSDYVVPVDRFGLLLERVEDMRRRGPLGTVRPALYLLIARRSDTAPDFAFSPAGSAPVTAGIGIYISMENDPEAVGKVRLALRELLEYCCGLGGRPYLYGVNDLDHPLMKKLYGEDLHRLTLLRSQYSLDHVNAHIPLVGADRLAL